ncbi:hypothetical protein RB653_008764 [Dictyostelium firmibasis]|uniref:Uncharacterized protein n=1 Tax=Dictyostelium firmibasis TaxID=79012 RepID=A0AAN7U0V4_9MYCE
MKRNFKFPLLLILLTLSFYIDNVICVECTPDRRRECTKSSPCYFSDKTLWPTNKVPTKETCDLMKFSGINKYFIIDKNIDIPKIELLLGVTVSFNIPNDSSEESSISPPSTSSPLLDQLKIDKLTVNNANLIIKLNNINGDNNNNNNNSNNNDDDSTSNNKVGLIKLLQVEIDDSNITIVNSDIRFQKVDINSDKTTINIENSKFELKSGSDIDEKLIFKSKLSLKSSTMNIDYLSNVNEPCYFSNGISSLNSNDDSILSSTAVSIKGNCILSGESEFGDLSISGFGFKIAESTKVVINGNFKNSDDFITVGDNSSIRFQAQIDKKDEENDSAPIGGLVVLRDLKIENIKLSETSFIIIGSDSETDNYEFSHVEISNVGGGIIQLENSVKENISLSNLKDTSIQTDIGNEIIISSSTIKSITDRGSSGNSSDSSTSLTFKADVTINKAIDISRKAIVQIGGLVTMMNDSTTRINDQHSIVKILGDVRFKSGSSLLLNRDRNAKLTVLDGAFLTLDNSTIQASNLTMEGGILSIVGQSTIDLAGSLILNGNATLLVSNFNSEQLFNKLFVKGDLKINSKQTLIRFDRLGKNSPHLSIDGDCLFNGNLEIYFNPNMEYHSEYHILKCGSSYTNQFLSTKIFLNNSLVGSSTYQIEQSDAIYLITEEYEDDDVEKTLNGWTLLTVLCITALAVLIISFYLFYKKKFKKQNNHYLPVELTEMN